MVELQKCPFDSISLAFCQWRLTSRWNFRSQQEDIEESARAELWREELIEEIELKVGGLRELEEAGRGREEELVK